jgi:hypothetical protein
MNSRRKQKTSQEEEIQSPLGKVNKMRTFSDLAKELNRSPVYLSGLQKRFEMPVFEDTPYSDAYIAFLRAFIALRTLNISEDILLELWHLEKKLLQLLHVDSTGSRTWFLDSCTAVKHPERHLLLTNYDLGIPLNASEVQIGLNFADSAPELFAGQEMGEDALRVLRECLKIRARILTDISIELPHVRDAVKWAATLAKHKPKV